MFLLQLLFYSSISSHALIGGIPADELTFPPSVIYIQNGCTATLVAPHKILLAAHCVLPFKNSWLHREESTIRFHRSAVASDSIAIEAIVQRIDIHPQWLQMINTGKNMEQFIAHQETADLAMLTLLQTANKIVPENVIIPLNFNPVSRGNEVLIGGYGCESFDQPNRNPRYKFAWKNISRISGNHFITNSKDLSSQSRSVSCEGDSGGPVFMKVNDQISIVGINSYVKQSSKTHTFVTGHVQIALFQDWLLDALRK